MIGGVFWYVSRREQLHRDRIFPDRVQAVTQRKLEVSLWQGRHEIIQESSKIVSLGAPLSRSTIPQRKHTRFTVCRSQPSQHITKFDRAISEIVPDSYGFPATANTAFDL